ncbi:hypothetical protein MBLNU457_4334t1 [Dothideomycetes sp. NU457]
MLDENLPVFFYKRSRQGIEHHTAIYTSYQGSEPTPIYTLKHADPTTGESKNCYAAALFDAYNAEILYGETLVRPNWAQPTLSQEEIRRNGGIPPPPQASRPTEFTIQLYEPDQQVIVRQKSGSLVGSTSYEFSLPQATFRLPSASQLDRTQDDPTASLTTPKLNFAWRKEGKLSKDYVCYMTGKSTDNIIKKKHRDPDIAIALYRSLREITIYEPNLSRIELEDPKGLEEVLLLSAATIKDVYLASNVNEIFSIQDSPTRKPSNPAVSEAALPVRRKPSPGQGASVPGSAAANGDPAHPRRPSAQHASPTSQPPPMPDARAQWELDAETARLRAATEAEERARRRERERADEAETRRLRRMVEEEQREAQRRQAAIDAETERLRLQYGMPSPGPPQGYYSPAPASGPVRQVQPPPPPRMGSNGLYMQPQQAHASTSVLMSGANQAGPSRPLHSHHSQDASRMKKKKSFWGRSVSDEAPNTLSKKSSAMW